MATLANALGTVMDPLGGVPMKNTAQRAGMPEGLLRMLLPALAAGGLGAAIHKGAGPLSKAFRARFGDAVEGLFAKANNSEAVRRTLAIRNAKMPNIDDLDFGSLAMAHQLSQQGLRREANRTLKAIKEPMVVDGGHMRLLIDPDKMGNASERAKMVLDREIEILPTLTELQGLDASGYYNDNVPFVPKKGNYTPEDLANPAMAYEMTNVMNPKAQAASASFDLGSSSMPSIVKMIEGTAAHEGAHAMNRSGHWLDSHVYGAVRKAVDMTESDRGLMDGYSALYTAKPTETVSHIHELRDVTRTNPGTSLADTLKKLGSKPRANSTYRRLIDAFTPESLDMLLRTIPVAAGAAAIPASAAYAYNHRES